jgi:hypothetical protein
MKVRGDEKVSEKISIDGHLFDTGKAKAKWKLELVDDGSNIHTGKLYLSSKGTWYVYTPSQWGNCHSWLILGEGKDGAEATLEQYSDYLEQDEINEIASMFGVEFE